MIGIKECFGVNITDGYGYLYRDFEALLSKEELEYVRSRDICDEPCIIYQRTVEERWLAIGVPGRYPRSFSQEDMLKKLEELVEQSSPMMKAIYQKMIEYLEVEFEDLTLYGEF